MGRLMGFSCSAALNESPCFALGLCPHAKTLRSLPPRARTRLDGFSSPSCALKKLHFWSLLYYGAPDGIVLLGGVKRVSVFCSRALPSRKNTPLSAASRSNPSRWVLISIMRIKKTPFLESSLLWGARWDSNPCISEPQSEVLTT